MPHMPSEEKPSDMPSEKPRCQRCGSTNSSTGCALPGLLGHLCISCGHKWNSATLDDEMSVPMQWVLPPGTNTASPLVHRAQITRTSFGSSSSAEIRSAFDEPDGVPERLPRWTYAPEIRLGRNGPQVLPGIFGTAGEAARADGRAAYAPRDATAILNFPNEFPQGCKAASSERQAVENAMLPPNERAKADDSFPGLYFVCKACGKTFSTHQAWEDHRLSHLELTPAKPNVSVNATTMPNRVSSGEVLRLAHQGSDDIEKGCLCDGVQGPLRWAIVVDPLFDVNVQGAFTLVALKTSNGSSPAKDVLLYVLGFVYVLGFLSAGGGKLFRSSKMQLIGWVAAALGFLLTMALLLV